MEILAIIPARGGSKGLPNKNILPLMGHPLIAYSIKAALDARSITRVIVSTDSSDIADIARQYGAEVPFMRPAEYAQDLSRDLEVFVHALEWLNTNEGYCPDLVVQLRPTSPVRPNGLIDEAIELMTQASADSLRVVTPSPITPYKMWTIADLNQPMQPLLYLEKVPEPFNEPRQELPQTYWQIGTLDVIKTDTILQQQSMSGIRILPYVVANEIAIDIDDLGSFMKVEAVINSGNYVRF